jgi:hypothetical protein
MYEEAPKYEISGKYPTIGALDVGADLLTDDWMPTAADVGVDDLPFAG